MQQYGDIRTLYTACKHRGFVMISYYDIRAASNAMKSLQNKPLRRRKLDIQYSIPKVSTQDVIPLEIDITLLFYQACGCFERVSIFHDYCYTVGFTLVVYTLL